MRRAAMTLAALLLVGCGPLPSGATGPGDGGSVAVSVVYQSAHCARQSQGVAWMSRGEVLEVMRGTDLHSEKAVTLPDSLDLRNYGVVGVWMGERRTAGYEVGLAQPTGRIRDGRLQLIVRWREPRADAMLAQVFTRPCLLIALPRGDYREIEVVDTKGRVRGRVVVAR